MCYDHFLTVSLELNDKETLNLWKYQDKCKDN